MLLPRHRLTFALLMGLCLGLSGPGVGWASEHGGGGKSGGEKAEKPKAEKPEKEKKDKDKDKKEKQNTGDYVAIPRLRLAVRDLPERAFGMIELEVWLSSENILQRTKLDGEKQKISNGLKARFLNENYKSFTNDTAGIERIKEIVRDVTAQCCNEKVEDIMIMALTMR